MTIPTPSLIKTIRDIIIFELNEDQIMVIGCDSTGGIGPKPLDKIRVDGYTLGKYTARVALMEVLSVGAKPVCLIDTLSVELEPTGTEIMNGIRDEVKVAGLDPTLAITGSSEKNIPVEQTGMGVTVVGMARKELLRMGLSKPKDMVAVIGIPCVGNEVVTAEKEKKIAEISDLLNLLNAEYIHDIISVGSRGICYEAWTLGKESDLKFLVADQQEIDLKKSAGPATVILVSLPYHKLVELRKIIRKPINIAGYLF